ncbi:MAG: glycosyltransferase family 4 protein [Vicinamibacterales bacterium]
MSPPIRVAVVTRSVLPLHGHGGLERHVYDLVRALAGAGLRVTLITREPGPESGAAAADIHPAITLITVPYRTFPLAGRRGTTVIDRSTAYPLFGERAGRVALELVRRGEIDIVHGLGASVLGYARQRSTVPAPLVMNPQGLEEFGATDQSRARLKRMAYLPLRAAVRRCARAADRVIATDRSIEPAVRAHLDLPADRVVTIPNALDLHWLDGLATRADGARIRRAAGIADDEVVLLSVGRLEENKGFHVLSEALGALRDHAPVIAGERWRWVLVGDGPYRGPLTRAIAAAGLTDRTLLTGRVDDRTLHAWYEAARVFVHPTLYEGSSLVTLEAMAHRLPVVATNAGGLPDKVVTGRNGWLIQAGDRSALAAAISGALGPDVDLAALGGRGRLVVEQEFSWDAAGEATIALYETLLGRGRN